MSLITRIEAVSVAPAATIRDAMQAIDRGALGVALLVDPATRRFHGLVTDGDIRRALLGGLGLGSPVAAVERPAPRVASVRMRPDQVALLFSEKVRVVPLLNDEGEVVDLALFDRRARLPVAEPWLGEKELVYVTECVLTGWVSSAGRFVRQFEDQFASFCGVQHAVATSNGTAALHLALVALGIRPGDEVIVPTLTFVATANAVRYTGATPVFVDSTPETWTIDPEALEAAITPRTKAIIPVHLYGHPADMDPILEIAARRGLMVIEDAAEAHGARYKGRRVGGLGEVGAFSFYGNKIVTTGEGGMLVTSRADVAQTARLLRDHGMAPDRRYWHPVLGFNYHMTNLQAALGVGQMERIDAILEAKHQIATAYARGLGGTPGLSLPPCAPWAENVFWLYTIGIDEERFGMTRDALMEHLSRQQIETRPVFPPLHTQPIYDTGQVLPVAERLARVGVSLPSAAAVSPEDIQRTIGAVQEAAAQRQPR